jgi:alpha-L-fucosidase
MGCLHVNFILGVLQKRKWENCMTIDKKSLGFRREADLGDYYTIEELLEIIIETIRYYTGSLI